MRRQQVRVALVVILISSTTGCYSIKTSELKSDIKPASNTASCVAGTTDVAGQLGLNYAMSSLDASALLVPELVRGGTIKAESGVPGRISPQTQAVLPSTSLIANIAIDSPDAAATSALAQATALSNAMSPASIDSRFKALYAEVPKALQDDKVFSALYKQARYTAARAQGSVAQKANIPSANFSVGTAQERSDNLSNRDFEAFTTTVKILLTSPDFAVGGDSRNSPTPSKSVQATKGISFKNAFVRYFADYYEGKFIDRFGTTISKPSLSLTISDTEIGNVVQVMWELILDYTLGTPVWTDGSKYYPGGSANKPTVLAENLVIAQSLLADNLSDHCGITKLKAEAIQYLANTASDRASAMGGLVTGSFGGFEVGLGFLGKFSFGDNQTIQTVVKTSVGEVAGRAAEEASYRTLYWIPYNGRTFVMEDIVQQFLDAHITK